MLQSITVYSEKYNLSGKIDLYDSKKFQLIERKKKVHKISVIGAEKDSNTLLKINQYTYDGIELAKHITKNKITNPKLKQSKLSNSMCLKLMNVKI